MATKNQLYPSLTDVIARTNPDGYIYDVAEMLQKTNPIVTDLPFIEGNLPTGHIFSVRTALPTPTWRRYNEGVKSSKSASETYTESCGMLEDYSKVDVSLAALNGNGQAYRASEDKAFVQGFNHEVARAILYESTKTNPERIHGLAARFGVVTGNPAGDQIMKADVVGGGAAANGSDSTSIWCIGWSDRTVYGIYPKGSKAGLSHEDLGKQVLTDSEGKMNTYWVTHWKWDLGLAVQDYRYISRVCNIDTSIWKADLTAGPDLTLCFDAAIDALKDLDTVRPVLYCNKKTFQMWRQQLIKKGTTNLLEYIQRGERKDRSYMGVPILPCDSITLTEDPVA